MIILGVVPFQRELANNKARHTDTEFGGPLGLETKSTMSNMHCVLAVIQKPQFEMRDRYRHSSRKQTFAAVWSTATRSSRVTGIARKSRQARIAFQSADADHRARSAWTAAITSVT